MNKSFTIAILGRPNVGKSTLFNRLAGTKLAITLDIPGVTRDRRENQGTLGPLTFKLIDTPGLEYKVINSLTERMNLQSNLAMEQADLLLLLVDGKDGLLPDDHIIATSLRKKSKNTILVVNKCEASFTKNNSFEFTRLGFGTPICISAEHNEGMIDLYDAIEPFYNMYQDNLLSEDSVHIDRAIKIAIVGRPNSGKSTFFNKLLGEERVITGPEAGITRDATSINWSFQNTPISLIDTAGMRRKSNIESPLEKFSVADTLKAIKYAHIVILLIDASQALESQDINIAKLVISEGRGLVIALNKWDTINNQISTKNELEHKINKVFSEIKGVPTKYISALHGISIYSPIRASLELYDLWNKKFSNRELNNWLNIAIANHPPPLAKSKRRIRLKYITQNKIRPPTFLLFANYPEEIEDSYLRYLTHSLREYLKLPAIPVRLILRKNKNPYVNS